MSREGLDLLPLRRSCLVTVETETQIPGEEEEEEGTVRIFIRDSCPFLTPNHQDGYQPVQEQVPRNIEIRRGLFNLAEEQVSKYTHSHSYTHPRSTGLFSDRVVEQKDCVHSK